VVRDILSDRVVAAAGHSLGELTAHSAAGTFTLAAGASLVRKRGNAMRDTGAERPGTMAAILGKLTTPIDSICAQATREAGLVVPANYNTDDQVVVSGEVAGVTRAMELAKAAGARRALRLSVSGAFHSPLMEPAELAFSGAIAETSFAEPGFPVYANVTAKPVTTGADARTLLLRQLTSPVRWSDEVRALAAAYPGALYVELGSGNVLSGLASRIVVDAHTIAVGAPADVDKLAEALG
jgi:[acyl-carrier-protein] S-malonyltransferase